MKKKKGKKRLDVATNSFFLPLFQQTNKLL